MADHQDPSERIDDLDAAVARNRATARNLVVAHAALVTAMVFVVVGAVLAVVGAPFAVALVLALAIGPLTTLTAVRRSQAWVLSAVGARPEAEADGLARLHNLLEALAVSVGVAEPAVWVVDDPGANLMSVWGHGREPVIVVTSGLSTAVDRLALEGLLAHELSHIRRGDPLVTTLAATLAGGASLLAVSGRGVISALASPFAPLAAAGIRSAVGRRREHLADLTAIQHTRYPPGLIAGLSACAAAGPGPASAPAATWPMWLASPATTAGSQPEPFDTHPPMSERLEALAEL